MDFIKKSILVHGDKYDYSEVKYKNSKTKVCIICAVHGKFWQVPTDHLNGSGCKKCGIDVRSNKRRLSKNFFISESNKVHGDKYDYSNVEYKNVDTKVCIICPIHGKFWQRPYNHKKGEGCPDCAILEKTKRIIKMNKDRVIDKNDFIKRANLLHYNKYNYDKSDYNGMHFKIKIICPEHGEFWQLPHNHLQPNHCPLCVKSGVSERENELLKFISKYILNVDFHNRSAIGLELDIYIPELSLAFEFNGLYWHSDVYKDKDYHLRKTEACEKRGIHLVHIYEDDWILKREIIESRIQNILDSPKMTIDTGTEIKKVKKQDAKRFFEENHLKGYVYSDYNVGLFFGGELVSLMAFSKLKLENNQWDLLRVCDKNGIRVVGSAVKLFRRFIEDVSPDVVVSYADRSWETVGSVLYNELGFMLDFVTTPNCFYIVDGVRVVERIGDEKYRIYDSGSLKFIYNKSS